MHIYVEGVDKTGKSTLVNKLRASFKQYPFTKFDQPINWYNEYASWITQSGKDALCDRSPLGQLVYGPVMRNEVGDNGKVYSLFNLLKTRNAAVVYCYRSEENIKKAFVDDKETYITANLIPALLDKYNEVLDADTFPLPVFEYNFDDDKTGEKIKELIENLKSIASDDREVYKFPYNGTFAPKTLFVGECFNDTNKTRPNAVPFDFGRASHYMKSVVPINADVGYINAFGDNNTLKYKIEKIKPQTVVALGNKAADACKKAKVQAISMCHPAHIFRYPDSKRTNVTRQGWIDQILTIIK